MNDENAGIGILKMRFTGMNFMQSLELLFRHMSAHSKDHYTYPPRNIKISKYSDHKKHAPCYLGIRVSGQMDCMRSLTEKILMQPALFHCVLIIVAGKKRGYSRCVCSGAMQTCTTVLRCVVVP